MHMQYLMYCTIEVSKTSILTPLSILNETVYPGVSGQSCDFFSKNYNTWVGLSFKTALSARTNLQKNIGILMVCQIARWNSVLKVHVE